jgi:hypothetical protein
MPYFYGDLWTVFFKEKNQTSWNIVSLENSDTLKKRERFESKIQEITGDSSKKLIGRNYIVNKNTDKKCEKLSILMFMIAVIQFGIEAIENDTNSGKGEQKIDPVVLTADTQRSLFEKIRELYDLRYRSDPQLSELKVSISNK